MGAYSAQEIPDLPDFITWNGPRESHPARLAAIESYTAVGSKDLKRWLEAFTPDAVVQDPVGPSMFDETGDGHHGHAAIENFWNVAIAAVAKFEFVIHDAHANPGAKAHATVGTFIATFDDGTRVDTDLVSIHEINDDGKIVAMRAYWNPDRAMATARTAD